MRLAAIVLATLYIWLASASSAEAGPVFGAIAAIGGIIAKGGIAGAILKAVVGFALNAAVSAIAGLANKAKQQAEPRGVKLSVEMGGDKPIAFVVGKAATAGKRKYIGTWGQEGKTPNAFLVDVIEIGSIPSYAGPYGLTSVWIGDEECAVLWDQPHPDGRGYPVHQYRRAAGDHLWIKYLDGSQTVADPYLRAKFGSHPERPWKETMVGRGIQAVILTARIHQELFAGGQPEGVYEPHPVRLYDITKDSSAGGSGPQRWLDPTTWTPTVNNMVIAYNIARGIYYDNKWVFGGQLPAAHRLPASAWMAAINECAAPRALEGGGTEPAYRGGLEITGDMEPLDAIEELRLGCNGRLAEVGGAIKPLVGAPPAAVYSVTDADILLTEGQSYEPFPGLADTHNAIEATYPEPRERWASKDAPARYDAALEAADGNRRLPMSVHFAATPYPLQVQHLMRTMLEDSRRHRVHQFWLPPDAWGLEGGIDTVSWSSARNGYNAKKFLVELAEGAANMCQLVVLREIDPADYDWSSDYELPSAVGWLGPIRAPVQLMTGWTAVPATIDDGDGTARRPSIRIGCDADLDDVRNVWVQVRLAATGAVVYDADSTAYAPPHQWVLNGVFLPATLYQARGKYIPYSSRSTEWSAWIDVLTPDTRLRLDELAAEVRESLETLKEWIDEDVIDDLSAQVGVLDARADALTAQGDALAAQADALAAGADQIAADLTAQGAALNARADDIAADLTAQGTALNARADDIAADLAAQGVVLTARADALAAQAAALSDRADDIAADLTAQGAALTARADDIAADLLAQGAAQSAQAAAIAADLADTAAALSAEQAERVDGAIEAAGRYRALLGEIEAIRAYATSALLQDFAAREEMRRSLTAQLLTSFATFDERIRLGASERAALASRTTQLEARAGTLGARVDQIDTARVDGDEALAQQIALLTVGSLNQFDPALPIWAFDASAEGWDGGGTPTIAGGYLRPADHASDAHVVSPVISVATPRYSQVRARVRKVGNPTWQGQLWWRMSGDTTWDAGRRDTIAEPTWADGIGNATWTPAWAAGTVTLLRLDLGTAQTATDYYEIDWIGIGRPSPGASEAELVAERQARISADSAIASDVTALSAALADTETGLSALAGGVDVLEAAVETIGDTVTAHGTALTGVNAALAGKASADALDTLTAEVSAMGGVGGAISQGEAVRAIRNSVQPLATGIVGQAFADHLAALGVGAALALSSSTLTNRIDLTDDRLTVLSGALTEVKAALPGVASASALETLKSTVVLQGDTLTAHGTALTSVQADLAGKAAASALDALTAEVTAMGGAGGITSQGQAVRSIRNSLQPLATGIVGQAFADHLAALGISQAISETRQTLTSRIDLTDGRLTVLSGALTEVKAALPGAASASALSALTAKVDLQGTTLTAHGTALTSVQADLAGKASVAALNGLTATVTAIGEDVDAQGDAITSLTLAVDGKASVGALDALTATVTAQGTTIAAHAASITSINAALPGKASTSALAALETTVTAQGTTIAAHTASITSINAALPGKASTTALAALAADVSEIDDKVTANTSAVTSINAALPGKASVGALDALTATVTAQGATITAHTGSINSINAALPGKASTTALAALETTVTAIGEDVEANTSAISSINAALPGKASVAAHNALSATVSAQGTTIAAHTASITSINAALPDKASVGALDALTATVTAQGTTIAAHTSAISSINAALPGKASTTALAALETTVTAIGEDVEANTSAISSINAALPGKASVAAHNALSATVSAHGTTIAAHTASINGINASLPDKASTAALAALAADVEEIDDKVTANTSAITTINAALPGKASVGALDALSATVTAQGTTIAAHTTSISSINTALPGKASLTAHNALVADVEAIGDDVEANTSAIASINAALPGKASVSALNTLSGTVTAQGTTIAAHTASIGSINAALPGKASAAALDALETDVEEIDGRVSANTTAIGSINAALPSKASASALDALSATVTAQGTTIAAHTTSISSINTALPGKASLTAHNALVADVEAIGDDVEAHTTAISSINTALPGKASASALDALTATVTAQGTTIAAHTASIGSINAALPGKASAAALDALETDVEEIDGRVSANTSAIGSINAALPSKASASALDALSATVTAQGTTIAAHTTSISSINAALPGKASVTALNGLAADVEAIGDDVEAHTTALTSISAELAGKANASALTTLAGIVTTQGGQIAAQATALTTVQTRVGEIDADARFKLEVVSGPAGYVRIGAQARVSGGGTYKSAGWYVDVPNNPSLPAQMLIDTQRFAIINGGSKVLPFVIDGGVVYMQDVNIGRAIVGDLQVGTSNIEPSAVTRVDNAVLGQAGIQMGVEVAITGLTVYHGAGGPTVMVMTNFNFSPNGAHGPLGSTVTTLDVRITDSHNGTTAVIPLAFAHYYQFGHHFAFTPPSAATETTFIFSAVLTSGGGANSPPVWANNRTIAGLTLKR